MTDSYRFILALGGFILVSPAACAGEVLVDQHDKQFTPDDLVLKPGDTLVFTNHDPINHNIQIVNSDGDAEDKGLQRPGEVVRQSFEKPGSYEVHCNIHPDMILMITVK